MCVPVVKVNGAQMNFAATFPTTPTDGTPSTKGA